MFVCNIRVKRGGGKQIVRNASDNFHTTTEKDILKRIFVRETACFHCDSMNYE